ncbi:hypothetical protein BpHYR1_008468, partial [Brachionus plicatilis]
MIFHNLSFLRHRNFFHTGFVSARLAHHRDAYQINNKQQNKFSWRCIERNCKAAGYTYTDKIGEECDFYITFEDHLDVPDVAKIELLERRRAIKERA